MAHPARAPQRPRRLDFQTNRLGILAAARRLMAERGLEALTVSEVAHRAGLNRTTAYQHFRTRDELIGAVVAELAGEISKMLVEPKPIGDRIDHMAHFFVDHPEVTRLTLHQLLSLNPLPREGWERYIGELRKLAASRRAQPGVDPEMLGYVLMCVGILWPLLARMEGEDEQSTKRATRRLTREVKRLLLHGVLRPEKWPDLEASLSVEPEDAA